MLEINPKYTDGSFEDELNVIDGRWIDITTGLFIDITAIRPKPNAKGVFASKDKHEEIVTHLSSVFALGITDADPRQGRDLFPLRESSFEGLPVKVPYNYVKLLLEEYGNSALTKAEYSGHVFNRVTLLWQQKV